MLNSSRRFRLSLVLALPLAGGWYWTVRAVEQTEKRQEDGQVEPDKAAFAPSSSLGGADRYLTYVSTDKPIYRPGEKLYVRGVVLHHANHRPVPSNQNFPALVSVLGPKGDAVANGFAACQDSALGFAWAIPSEMPGGQYTIRIQQSWSGQAPAERKFEIRSYRAPRLKSQIKFIRDGYGPGDEVAASLHVERAEGGIPVGAKVAIQARVDGQTVFEGKSVVNEKGNCVTKFSLPKEIERGEGVLSMAIEDGGILENASKTLPILLQTVDLTLYPEGGDLVVGLKSRVYFEAFAPTGKPADLAGVVVDDRDKPVAEFRSEHEGRGRFWLTPKADTVYRLKITEPNGIDTEFPLPKAKKSGAVITAPRDTYRARKRVALKVEASSAPFTVTLSKRENILARQTVNETDRKSKTVRLDLPDSADGVLVATVWGRSGKPLAERLIFRQPARALNVKVSADAPRYTPGGIAKLTVETTDQKGRPVSAIVGLTVSDDSVVEMIEQREQPPKLKAMVFLEHEVRELADSHIYLDARNDASPLALDLLLGTQGWRRFAFFQPQDFAKRQGDAAWRVLASVVAQQGGRGLGGGLFANDVKTRFRLGIDGEELAAAEGRGEDEGEEAPAAAAPAKEVEDLKRQLVGKDKNEELAQAAERPARKPARAKAAKADGLELKKVADQEVADEADFRDRRLGGFGGGGFGGGGRGFGRFGLAMPANSDFLAVRVYAHAARPNRQANDREDFAETLYWHAGVKTDDRGMAVAEFALSDSVTSFRVSADAFSSDGVLGGNSITIDSVKPFYMEPKLPLEVTSGDHLQIPLGLVNATSKRLEQGRLKVLGLNEPRSVEFALEADARKRILVDMLIGNSVGDQKITLDGSLDGRIDKITRKFVVKPRGFPIEDGRGGLLATNGRGKHEFVIPESLVHGSLTTRVVVYPTPLASMNEALSRLIREPNGCFEQTSSTTYPLVMAQQYFMSHEGVDPALIERSDAILAKGYQRLLGFESSGGGFEWFGRNPGHDALTAYGLLEFTDMAKVRSVDAEMLTRTSEWLLDQRDGKGGFVRKTATLHTWVADPEIANTYNLWALLESKVAADLSAEVAWVRDAGEKTQNAYVLALAANALGLAGDKEGQNHLLDELAGLQNDEGVVDGATRSVVGSTGDALRIETTSLAVMAWLQNSRYAANVEAGIKFLAERCKAGRFGSTQSTILALRAIVAYDASRAAPKSPGQLTLLVDGAPVGKPVDFDEQQQGAIELPAFSSLLTPGNHQVEVVMNGGSPMPYSIAFDYHSLKPNSSTECALHVHVELKDKVVEEGTVTEANVEVVNTTDEKVASPIAIIGIPGGLEVRHDQLKELVKAEKIAAYEVIGREVVLYWRALDVEQRVELPLSLVAAIPGSFSAPASRTYLYYTDELKHWDDGVTVKIEPSKK